MSSRPSPALRLAALEESIAKLEAERKELEREVQEKEILEKVLAGEVDLSPEQEKELHSNCLTEEARASLESEVESAREEAAGELEEVWGYLEEFGSHTARCLSGALAGNRSLHRLCTCGWNEVATELERQ